ncbi:MAG: VOC family protein [Chloroflexi bacterium]|nr:VOC family protein [Chloroflexota bacterium]
MLTGFDHFIVLVNDLNAAMESFRRLGFDARAGGEHPTFGSHNALVALADGTYLELVAFKNPALAEKSFWRDGVRRVRAGEGFGGFVLGANDLANDVAQLAACGLKYDAPQAGARVRLDGQRVEWHTAMFGGLPTGALPFLIQDDTPRALRIEPPSDGLGSRARAKEVVVVVKNLAAERDHYSALLGVEPKRVHNKQTDVEGYRFALDWGSIVVARPTRGGNTMTEQLDRRGEGLFALALQVDSWGWERQQLRNRDIQFENEENGFFIAPEEACGARIRIVGKVVGAGE